MRHLKKGRKLGRERDQRRALLKSLASSFFLRGRIKTTEAKAREVRRSVERFITRAKNLTLANRRYLAGTFPESILKKIVEAAAEFKEKPGGYTRIIKLGSRKRDGAKMAVLELAR